MKVWVDVESGTWGSDPDSIYVMEVPDELVDTEYWGEGPDNTRCVLAKISGVQLKLVGCDDVAHKIEMEED